MQALYDVLQRYGTKHDLMWLMTRVNCYVACQFKSSGSEPALNNKKQIPAIVSQLTKQLYFTPKVCKAMDISSSDPWTEIRPGSLHPQKSGSCSSSSSGRSSPKSTSSSGSGSTGPSSRNQQSSTLCQQSSRLCERPRDTYTSQVVGRFVPAPVSPHTPALIINSPTLVWKTNKWY